MGHQNVHGAQHVDGSDNIPLATASTPGLMSAQQFLDLSDSVANTWLRPILSTLDIPPVTPLVGDRYRIVPTAVGAWTGLEDQIAEWTGAWTFTVPAEGMMVYDLNLDRVFRYEAGAWAQWPAAADVDEAGATMNTDTDLTGYGWFKNDPTFATPDATKAASEAAIKTYVDNAVTGLLDYKGAYDATTDPDGAALVGDTYTVTVEGTGVASYWSKILRVGDMIIAESDNPASEADWTVVERNLDIATESVLGIVKVATDVDGLIDGDKLNITWDPTNYTPSVLPAEADDVDDLTAHLYGIDQALGTNASDISNHVGATAVHGVTGDVVGTTDAQTLTNKTLTTPTISLKQSAAPVPTAEGEIEWDTDNDRIIVGDGVGQKAFYSKTENDTLYAPIANGVTGGDTHDHNGGDGAQIDHLNLSNIGSNSHAVIDSHIAAAVAHGVTGSIVGTTDAQTLTNKTLTTPSLTLAQGVAPTPTAEGDIQWDTDNDRIVVGDGVGQKSFYSKTENDTLYAPIANGVTNGDTHDHNGGDGAQIDHVNLASIGSNTHAQIDTHIADTSVHYTVASIDHGAIAGLGDDDHTIYLLASGARAMAGDLDMGTNDITNVGRYRGTKGADVASANDITLGDGNYFDITGTTQINTIATTNWTAGSIVVLQFDASVTVAHNTAGAGASILLSGAGNFSATVDDTLTLAYDGVTWREIARTVI